MRLPADCSELMQDEGTGLSNSGRGLASLLNSDPQSNSASPRVIMSPHSSMKQPGSHQLSHPAVDHQQLASHPEASLPGEEGQQEGERELTREELEEHSRAEKQRAKDRAKRRWQNARPMQHKAVPSRSLQHRTGQPAIVVCLFCQASSGVV